MQTVQEGDVLGNSGSGTNVVTDSRGSEPRRCDSDCGYQ